MSNRAGLVSFAVATFVAALSVATAHGEGIDALAWRVGKTSGDVWVTTSGVQPASLADAATVKPGDSIRTGRNGRVLLTRGEEKILIAPNSIIAIPEKSGDAASTTIVQQAGSILLEVEKRDTRTFEVETPYLVAAVKGTQFRVSVDDRTAAVAVMRGQVEVADNKSGRFALVLPGQTARVSAQSGGLSVRGFGVIGPIQQGQPRTNTVPRVPVPRGGLAAPTAVNGRHVRAIGAALTASDAAVAGYARGVRISAPLGDVRLDVHKATNGLAHAPSQMTAASRTVWKTGELTPGNGIGKSYNLGNNGSGTALGSANGNSAGNGNAGGNGSTGGNGSNGSNGNSGSGGSNGNGNAYGLNGGNGNGNAYGLNGGNGKGHAYGHSK
jgi:hypothetical protein